MANGQPLIQGGVNVASANTTIAAPTITASNKTAFSAFGPAAGVGLFGTAAPLGPNLLSDDVGVIGQAQTTGVLGSSGGGLVEDGNGNILFASAGVAGVSGNSGVGVHGSATAGFGVLGQDASGIGVQGTSVSGLGVVGESATAAGVTGRSGASIGVSGEAQTAQGVFGKSTSSAGVAGTSSSGSGVHGRSVGGIGVVGDSSESIGVYGSSTGMPGVRGDSNSQYGVFGTSISGNGVYGWSTQGPAGVSGYSAQKHALHGESVSGYGLWAESSLGVGVFGYQSASQVGGAGVVGLAETGVGVAAMSRSNVSLYALSLTNLAARFDGGVEVHGSFRVIGGPKSAVVRHKDGTHRQLYCMESPESWFEDFGEARVNKGVCDVRLDAEFAALVDTSSYQVFLTSYGPASLYVSKRSTKSFEIRVIADDGGAVAKTVRCAYRIVARRKDIKAPRLAKIKVTDAPMDLVTPKSRKTRPEPTPKKIEVKFPQPKLRKAKAIPPAPKLLKHKAFEAERDS
jgi:hypothetical protein